MPSDIGEVAMVAVPTIHHGWACPVAYTKFQDLGEQQSRYHEHFPHSTSRLYLNFNDRLTVLL